LKPVDPEYEEWLDDLDKERNSNKYVEGEVYGNKERKGSHSG